MAFKDRYMWGQVASSIGKRFTDTALLPCQAYQNRPHHPAHGVAAALVAAQPRNRPKIPRSSIEMQSVMSSTLPYSTSGKLTVSLSTRVSRCWISFEK